MALASALAGAAAHWFEGSCPLDASSWVCGHWTFVVAVATVVLGAFGVKVNRPKLAASKAAQRIEQPKPPPAPEPEPATSGEVVIETRDPGEIDWDKRDG
jgi:hypothetical protein